MRVLVTGGAGFVGASLCRLLKAADAKTEVVAFDNLKRRGSELNLPAFAALGVKFVHGDIRNKSDFDALGGAFDLFIEASAEPSVHAGTGGGSPSYLLDTNLVGTLNCLEFGRAHTAGMIFLSTSRVYSIPALRALKLKSTPTRFELDAAAPGSLPGVSAKGIDEDFPVVGHGFRSLYGSTKLASELFVEEYAANYGYPSIINRCGVIAGPGQFGKTDQGVYTLWVARHVFGGPLSYTGFGGRGLQVRDLLHPRDLFALIERQLPALDRSRAALFTVGGGAAGAVSLREYTEICQGLTERRPVVGAVAATNAVDIPYFVADSSRAEQTFSWRPTTSPTALALEIRDWLIDNRTALEPLFHP